MQQKSVQCALERSVPCLLIYLAVAGLFRYFFDDTRVTVSEK